MHHYSELWFDIALAIFVILAFVFVELRVRKLRRDQKRALSATNAKVTDLQLNSISPKLSRGERAAARVIIEQQLKNGSKS